MNITPLTSRLTHASLASRNTEYGMGAETVGLKDPQTRRRSCSLLQIRYLSKIDFLRDKCRAMLSDNISVLKRILHLLVMPC